MDEKDPSLISMLGGILVALLGGAVAYLQKLYGQRKFVLKELLIDLAVSSFVGLLTMLFCQGAGINHYIAGALAGVMGHWGSRSLALVRGYLAGKVKSDSP